MQKRLKEELGEVSEVRSKEYEQFRQDNTPRHHTFYEKAASFAGGVLALKPSEEKTRKVQEYLNTAHLACDPKDAASLSILAPFALFITSVLVTVFLPFVFAGTLSLWWLAFSMIIAVMVYVPLANMPQFLARRWKQRASNQMVLCVFYMVTYMRHTPNLELALEFAADHIGPPLSLDLKKVLWDVETEHFQSVSESLEHYLSQWRDDAREFIESVHLVQSSLYEGSDERRLSSLDKALDVMLDETYEKMLHYAQDLKSPMTMLHMLGIILPILGLVILPLAVSFFETHWTVIFSLYNVLLPAGVYYLGKRILSSRPTGYGQADLSLDRYAPPDKKRLKPGVEAGLIAAVLFAVGISPIVIHLFAPGFDLSFGGFDLLGYTDGGRGPYGLGAGLLSLFVTLAAGLGAGYYYRRRTKSLIKIRRRTRELESEFASALFQLGNRIGDGIPTEIAFSKVAVTMQGTRAGEFFNVVSNNISRLGMGVEDAVFSDKRGALRQFPSNLIESSMKVLVESSRKGPHEASKALMSMSNYIKEMHRVDERLKDLLSDVLSSMKSQVNFLLPTIAGIVIGITSMITTVLGAIQDQAAQFEGSGAGGSIPVDMFGLGIPTFYFQIVVGLYVVQVTWILATLISGIENGVDPLSEMWIKGKSLILSAFLYCGIAFVVIMVFNLIAGQIISTI